MAKRQKSEPTRETRRVDQLKPFPDQEHVFVDLSPDDLRKLANGIRGIGLTDPIQILPKNSAGFAANTVIDGHQRLAAIQLLGWAVVEVIVRYDLADATRQKIEEQFAGPNLHRRHMTAIQRLRAWLYYYERSTGQKVTEPSTSDDEAFLEGARQCTGTSGRHLKRLLKIIELPTALQHEVDAGRLRMMLAERVARMDESDQQEIMVCVAAGEDPNKVVSGYFPPRIFQIEDAVQKAVWKFMDGMRLLNGRMDEVSDFGRSGLIDSHCQSLMNAEEFLRTLQSGLQQAKQKSADRLRS